MPKNENDDLSDLLSDLAAAQARQEEELSALTGEGGAKAKKQEAERIAEEELLAEQERAAASTATVEPQPEDEIVESEPVEEEADEPVAEVEPEAESKVDAEEEAVEPELEPEPEPVVEDELEPSAAASSEDEALAAMAAAAGTEQGEALEEGHVAEFEAPIDLGVKRRRTHSPSHGGAHGRMPQRGSGTSMNAVMAPILLMFGLQMLGLAVWGTLLATGASVPLSNLQGAGKMGLILAIAGGLIGLFLLVYAIISLVSLRQRDEEE
mgnify:CR=1 FL=1